MVKVSVRDTDLDSFPVVAWRREIENGECEKGARRMQEVRKTSNTKTTRPVYYKCENISHCIHLCFNRALLRVLPLKMKKKKKKNSGMKFIIL